MSPFPDLNLNSDTGSDHPHDKICYETKKDYPSEFILFIDEHFPAMICPTAGILVNVLFFFKFFQNPIGWNAIFVIFFEFNFATIETCLSSWSISVGSENSVGCFLSFRASPYWWRAITNFVGAKRKSRIFPLQSLFRHFKHVYGLIFKHESVSQEYLQDFEMKLKSLLTRSFATKLTGHCIW